MFQDSTSPETVSKYFYVLGPIYYPAQNAINATKLQMNTKIFSSSDTLWTCFWLPGLVPAWCLKHILATSFFLFSVKFPGLVSHFFWLMSDSTFAKYLLLPWNISPGGCYQELVPSLANPCQSSILPSITIVKSCKYVQHSLSRSTFRANNR